jgi:CheY-like chemotaxis protein
MATNTTLLCIHRDPAQLSVLQEEGYKLVTATNGGDGLRLFMSGPVDAIVLDYHLGLLDGAVVAAEIKRVKPRIPVVMLAENLELPDGALKSVDALVAKADGPHFLLQTLQSVLDAAGASRDDDTGASRHELLNSPGKVRGPRTLSDRRSHKLTPENMVLKDAPFSAKVWKSIWNGTVRF